MAQRYRFGMGLSFDMALSLDMGLSFEAIEA
jgi:hypothetical protein